MSSRYTTIEKSILHSLYRKYDVEVDARNRNASRDAWERLKVEFNGSAGVITVNLFVAKFFFPFF